MNAREAAVAELERRLGYQFRDRELLERALTHASVGDRSPSTPTNERLEFLGDRVLNLIIAEDLMLRLPDATEGELTKRFHQLIDARSCAAVAREVALGQALLAGGSGGKTGIRKSERVIADAVEALIAALYLDGGLEVARTFVLGHWAAPLNNLGALEKDPKTLLNEWAMARGLPPPAYRVVSRVGEAHAPNFQIQAFVEGALPETAEGGTKKVAERRAAELLLRRLSDHV